MLSWQTYCLVPKATLLKHISKLPTCVQENYIQVISTSKYCTSDYPGSFGDMLMGGSGKGGGGGGGGTSLP